MSRKFTVYIASSWRNQAAVEMLTHILERHGYEVRSFVRNCGKEPLLLKVPGAFDEWVCTDEADEKFAWDLDAATTSDLVVYLGPSGCDAWAEVGAAWAAKVPVVGLMAKGDEIGLMRLMVRWSSNVGELLAAILAVAREKKGGAA